MTVSCIEQSDNEIEVTVEDRGVLHHFAKMVTDALDTDEALVLLEEEYSSLEELRVTLAAEGFLEL